jgi:hypothetical protein
MINKSTHKKHIGDYDLDVERFIKSIDIRGRGDCWNWKRGKNTTGYGLHAVKSPSDVYERTGRVYTQLLAHRVAAFLAHKVGIGDYVMHMCDNRLCCNPYHLQVGTALDNHIDAKNKGRWHGPIKMIGDNGELLYPEMKRVPKYI